MRPPILGRHRNFLRLDGACDDYRSMIDIKKRVVNKPRQHGSVTTLTTTAGLFDVSDLGIPMCGL